MSRISVLALNTHQLPSTGSRQTNIAASLMELLSAEDSVVFLAGRWGPKQRLLHFNGDSCCSVSVVGEDYFANVTSCTYKLPIKM